jgi:hypothetical protein
MLKPFVVALCALAGLLLPFPSASASLWSGTCALDVTFSFSSPVRRLDPLALTRPSYSISVAPAVDLDPLTGGSQPCAVTLSGTNPFRETSVSASGTSTLWTCEATSAGGSWTQGWNGSPPSVNGSHLITGGSDAWTMVVHNGPPPTFAGSMELVIHPDDAGKLAQCELNGVSSLKMTGVMVFQDP